MLNSNPKNKFTAHYTQNNANLLYEDVNEMKLKNTGAAGCNIPERDRKWAEDIFARTEEKFARVTVRSRDKLPYGVDKDGRHINMYPENKPRWTNGFWGALNMLLYNRTRREDYLLTARRSQELLDDVLQNYVWLDHDVGFMWHILSGADYKITGDLSAKNRNLFAASTLFSRFVLCGDGGFIRAWNGGGERSGWSIVDCLMNLSLLYWASEELGDDRFRRVAMAHADMALRDHLRGDGSVNHIVEHDRQTGRSIKTYGGQGYGVGSSWSRGCAWALYGFAISYAYTGEERYSEAAVRVAEHFIKHCQPAGWLPVIDFYAPAHPVYYDSTAGACAACGMLLLNKLLPAERGGRYSAAAINILRVMTDKFCDFSLESDCLLKFGSERYPVEGDPAAGVHMPIIYGDYFYTEAILALLGEEFNPW